ncbi:MAG: ferredoxin [Candidatus Melainabacteria bacterium]
MQNTPHAPVMDARINRHVFVCTGASCSEHDSAATLEAFRAVLKQAGLLYGKRGSMAGTVVLTTCGSVGFCNCGPAVLVYPDGVWYHSVTAADVPEIVSEHLQNNRVVSRLVGLKLTV